MTSPQDARDLLKRAGSGVLFYGVTPPRLQTEADRCDEIAARTLSRLGPVEPDALVLYDVDAENSRESAERPFPFLPMMDPSSYLSRHLGGWQGPAVVYRCVGKYPAPELRGWLAGADPAQVLTVLVGSSSSDQPVATRLPDAYRLRAEAAPGLTLGGVVIAERHTRKGDEHLRMLAKQDSGCSFFVSQVCYDLDHTRDLLSDYAYACRDRARTPGPVVLTISPCGSAKTLEFMTWLGIDVPRWLANEIVHSGDPLDASYQHCLDAARALVRFCRRLDLPFGINVESVTNRKVEIEASIELAREVRGLLGRP